MLRYMMFVILVPMTVVIVWIAVAGLQAGDRPGAAVEMTGVPPAAADPEGRAAARAVDFPEFLADLETAGYSDVEIEGTRVLARRPDGVWIKTHGPVSRALIDRLRGNATNVTLKR
jgi:hypothetical protein